MNKIIIPILFTLLVFMLYSCEKKIDKEAEEIVMRGIPNKFEVLDTLFETKKYTPDSEDCVSLNYRLYIPESDNEAEKIPLVVFLHGKAERGDDNYRHIEKNTPFDLLMIDEDISKQYKCATLAPQISKENEWEDDKIINTLVKVIKETLKNDNINKDKVYVIGISMGGTGIYKLLSINSDLFSGALSICGGEPRKNSITENIKYTPIWSFYAVDDPFEKVKTPRKIIEKIKKFNGNIKYTEYENGGHMIWDKVYNEPEVFEWLFSQTQIH